MKCGLDWCPLPLKWDGLCHGHALLFDWWGCEDGGYAIYQNKGKTAGRRAFTAWLKKPSEHALKAILAYMNTTDFTPQNIERIIPKMEKYGKMSPPRAKKGAGR